MKPRSGARARVPGRSGRSWCCPLGCLCRNQFGRRILGLRAAKDATGVAGRADQADREDHEGDGPGRLGEDGVRNTTGRVLYPARNQ